MMTLIPHLVVRMGQWWIVDYLTGGVHTTRKYFDMDNDIYYLFMRAVMGHQMANFWIWVDTSLGSSVPICICIYIQQVYFTRQFWTFMYLELLFFLLFDSGFGVVDCYRSLHPVFLGASP